jgi:PAS domain S-box-containing protein
MSSSIETAYRATTTFLSRRPLSYGAAALLIAAATLLTWLIPPLAVQTPFVFFYAAVYLVTAFGGLRPGLFTVAASAVVGSLFFLHGAHDFMTTWDGWISAFAFLAVSSLICVLTAQHERQAQELRTIERQLSTDLDSRRQAEQQIRFQASLLDMVDQAVIATDRDFRIIYWNRFAETLYGWSLHEASGRSIQELLTFQLSPQREEEIRERVKLQKSWRSEVQVRRRDGLPLSIEVHNTPFFDDTGALGGLIGVSVDISERRRVTEALRKSEARFRAIFEYAAVGVAQVRLDGAFEQANPYLCTMLGYEAAEMQRFTVQEVTHPDDRPLQVQNMRRMIEGEMESFTHEKRYCHKNGSILWGNLVMSLVRDSVSGQPLYFIKVLENISERKRVELQLEFLANASVVLSNSLEYQTTVQQVADLLVPEIGDWCAVDLLRPNNEIESVAIAHTDPRKVQWAQEVRRRFPPSLEGPAGVAAVIRNSAPEYQFVITDEMMEESSIDEESRQIVREIGFRSYLAVPLNARGATIGALTLVCTRESNRYFDEADVLFASEIAGRVAIAVDNALLYEEARTARQQQGALLAQLEALFANAPIGIAFLDQEQRYLRVNPAMAAINELSVEAHLGRRLQDVQPQILPVFQPLVEQVMATGETFHNLEVRGRSLIHRDELRTWLVSWYPVIREQGRSLIVGTVVIDITEQKRAAEALRASEERFRATFEQAAVGIGHVDLTGRWLRVNHRLSEITGYTRQELLGMSFRDVTFPDDLALDLQKMEELIAGRIDGFRIEKRYVRKDGAVIWVHLTSSLVYDAGNNPQYLIGVIEDISDRKAAEARSVLLADSSRILSAALFDGQTLQKTTELIVPRLADWCVINLVQPDGAIELTAAAHIDPEKVELLHRLATAYPLDVNSAGGTPGVIRSGKPELYVRFGEEEAGTTGGLSLIRDIGVTTLMIVPLQARQQTLGAMTLARNDVHRAYSPGDLQFVDELAQRIALMIDNANLYVESQATEVQLRHLNETLEERVAERTAELERSNQELDRFAYIVSHDLKAPLRAINNLALWIHEDALDALPATAQTHLTKLRGRVQRMERLLDDLLIYSRTGRIDHAPQLVQLASFVRSIFDLLAPPPDFTLIIHDEVSELYTQRVPLETVLRNLIGNAIKHHDRPDGQLILAMREVNEWVEIEVADDGPGIAPLFHQRIFEMFQTLRPRDQVEGSGMGLAIVKKTVENLGGTITLESELGQGSRFRFLWPKR